MEKEKERVWSRKVVSEKRDGGREERGRNIKKPYNFCYHQTRSIMTVIVCHL